MDAPTPEPPRVPAHRTILALLVALASLAVSLGSLARNQPLGHLGGLADEWLYLGANVAVHHTLGLEREPMVSRPPGYPAFIAAVLWLSGPLPPQHDQRLELPFARAVYTAQAFTLAGAAVLVFLWLLHGVSSTVAFMGAVWFGCNPYSVALVSLRRYETVHWFLLAAGCLALEIALGAPRSRVRMLGVGALWGLATLTRPVTLLLPPFIALAAWWRRGGVRPALWDAASFTVGMALLIAPWTVRNYAVAGRIIPVNAQAWTATWASTVEATPADPDRYKWYKVANDHYQPIYAKVTGEAAYSYPTFVRNVLPLEEAFRLETFANLRRQPAVYLHNVAVSFVSLQTSTNAIILTVFRRLQEGVPFDSRWLPLGWAGNLERGPEAVAYSSLHTVLTLLALAGIILGLRDRNGFVVVPLLTHLALSMAHALTYLDTLYYYFKLPFLVVLAFYGLSRLAGRYAGAIAGGLTAAALLLTGWIHFS